MKNFQEYTHARHYCSFLNYALNNYQDKITNSYSHFSTLPSPIQSLPVYLVVIIEYYRPMIDY